MISEVGSEVKGEEKRAREALFTNGEPPPSRMRKARRLMIEADGVSIALQRQKNRRRTELKLAVAYEGWEPAGSGRFRTVEKMVHSGLSTGEVFWRDFSVSLASKYDLKGVEELVLGGDGASWIRAGGHLFPIKRFQLDRFHLKRALRTALGPGNEKVRLAYRNACRGDHRRADEILEHAQSSARGEKKDRIGQVRRYLASNRDGLADWRDEDEKAQGERGMGTIETNVDKILANRVKKRGMSWVPEGADSMAKVIKLRQNDELGSFIRKHRSLEAEPTMLSPALRQVKSSLRKDPEEWLSTHMPALDGPHSDRLWVSVLRDIAHLPKVV